MRNPNSDRNTITIDAALEGLTATDRELVETVIVLAGAVSAYLLGSGIYTGFVNEAGEVVAYLHSSLAYITVTPRAAHIPDYLPGKPTPASIEAGGYDVFLATWEQARQATTRHAHQDDARVTYCGACYIAVPIVTGVCEACAD